MPFCAHHRVSNTAGARPPSLFSTGAPTEGHAPSPRNWYALRLKANREFQVRDALEANGLEAFLPTWSEEVRWSDRTKKTTRPLFPGYIFAHLARIGELSVCLCTRGVVQILPENFNPIAVDEKELNDVRRVMAAQLDTRPCEFVAGDTATIDSGPLAGVSGVVKRTRGSLRVVVSVEILRRAISVELDAATLLKTPTPET